MLSKELIFIVCFLTNSWVTQVFTFLNTGSALKVNLSQATDCGSWHALLQFGGAVILHATSHGGERFEDEVGAVVFQKSIWEPAKILGDVITATNPGVQCVYLAIDTQTIETTLQFLNQLKSQLSLVILAIDNVTLVMEIFHHVMSTAAFRWTALVHVTEWLIITSRRIEHLTNSTTAMPDFVTAISLSGKNRNGISIYQKSRTKGFTEVSTFDIGYLYLKSAIGVHTEDFLCIKNYSIIFPKGCYENVSHLQVFNKYLIFTISSEIKDRISANVRKIGKLYLRSRKSVLDGVHVKVSFFVYPEGQDKMVMERKLDNRTVVEGFYISMLDILEQGLGFTYEVILVNDSGYFGRLDADGQATGIVGHLARREAAFSLIPLSMSLPRLEVIDFVSVCPVTEYTKVIYRLPEPGSTIDITYVSIIQLDFVVTILIGPIIIMAFIGAFLHVISRSCTTANPQRCSFDSLKELYSYPDHFCFETHVYVSQSGRVLKATWGVFWLILSTAYSAYLTTTFAVKSKELQIDSLKALAEVQGYDIGIYGGLSGFISGLNEDNPDPAMRSLAQLLQRLNRSDPMTFSNNVSYHMERVLKGGYVFMTVGPLPGITEGNTKVTDPLLRAYSILEPSNIQNTGVAKDVFFKDDLYRYLLSLQESSVSHRLKQIMFKHINVVKETLTNEEVPVCLKRIELLVYVVLACLAVSITLLLVELIMDWLLKKKVIVRK